MGNLGVEMALFGTPSEEHQPAHSWKHNLGTCIVDPGVTHAIAVKTERRTLVQYMSLSNQRIKCSNDRHLTPSPLKPS